MKLIFLLFNLFFFLLSSAQDSNGKIYLLDSLEERFLYKIDVIVEKSSEYNSYYFMIGRVQRGFYAFGGNKKINTLNNDTTRLTYHKSLLEKSQIDSLKKFEQKLMALNKSIGNMPRQCFILSYETKNSNYLIKGDSEWDAIHELILILFRQKD